MNASSNGFANRYALRPARMLRLGVRATVARHLVRCLTQVGVEISTFESRMGLPFQLDHTRTAYGCGSGVPLVPRLSVVCVHICVHG